MIDVEQSKEYYRASLRRAGGRELGRVGKFIMFSCAAAFVFGFAASAFEAADSHPQAAIRDIELGVLAGSTAIAGAGLMALGDNIEFRNEKRLDATGLYRDETTGELVYQILDLSEPAGQNAIEEVQ